MGRAEAGTPKAIANAMKAKGLGRLRWYCQVCAKQCRDENGFKMHSQSETHLRKMLVVGENAGKHIDDFSKAFLDDFIQMLSRRHNTQRVRANQVYNEYIQDKNHLHMNATKWVTLTEFVKYLGREGIVRADENEKGWWISWVDNSPKALARQAELQKRERADMDDEQRQRRHLNEQIERARLQAEARKAAAAAEGTGDVEEGLKRDGEGVRLSLNLASGKDNEVKSEQVDGQSGSSGSGGDDAQNDGIVSSSASALPPRPPAAGAATSQPQQAKLSLGGIPPKRPQPGLNVFKQSSSKPSSSSKRPREQDDEDEAVKKTTATNLAQKKFLTAAEKLMLEDQERKRRNLGTGSSGSRGGGGGGYQGVGPQRGGR